MTFVNGSHYAEALAQKHRLTMPIQVGKYDQALSLAYEVGWTDGLPIVPPTAERVRAFLDASGRSVDDWPITCLQAGVWATLGGT
jgi:hypothetical protein